ncbi:unnamed protein product [Dicrocoelium dendriticum]|nr:unnamed protein product [Dicrocoelium dendriticum]
MFMTTRFDKFARGLKTTKRMRLGLPNKRLDWRQKGAVTPVEDQGRCGSCWAFSVVGNIESQYYLSGRNLTVLSKQQLVDCDRLDDGCDGGYPPQTYSEVIRLGGLVSGADYPYEARRGSCRLNKSQIVANINLALLLPRDEEYQAKYLGARGPLSTVLNAKPLQFYRSGIFSPPFLLCSNRDLNHAVVTVGYGQDGRFPYWIVKNSWGTDWGEEGYFRIRRGRGVCGIDRMVTTAVI